jgi:hypothetical protein
MKLLAKAREDLQKRAQASRAEAAQARGDAETVGKEMRALVNEVAERRSGELATLTQDATDRLQKAVAAAQQAGTGSKTSAQMTAGLYNQALGDVYWSRAQGHAAWAQMLETLGGGQPVLSDAGHYKTGAQEAQGAAKEMLDKATEAYEAADQAYQAAGAQGDAAERIERINALLAQSVKITSGGSKDIRVQAVAPEPTPAPEGGETPVAAAADGGTPNDAVRALNAALELGHTATFESYFVAETDEQRQVLKLIEAIAPSGLRLQKAIEKRFGPEAKERVWSLQQQSGLSQLGSFGNGTTEFQVDGDTATATTPNGQPLVMKRVDGRWKIDMSGATMPTETFQGAMAMAPLLSKAMDEVSAEVDAGKHQDVESVIVALGQKFRDALGNR